MRRNLRGRVVLITGSSRGIGRRVAVRLAARGARLALTARSGDELAELANQLKADGAEVEYFPADLTRPDDRQRLVRGVVDRFGGLDVLVNCAGVCSFGEFASSTEDVLRKVLEINFFAQAELIRLATPELTRSAARGHRPAIVNVASICGRAGIPSLPEHCASKHAFVGLTESLRAEFARFDIDVLLVLPGLVRSDDLNRHLLRNEGRIYLDFEGAQPPDEVAAGVLRSLVRNRPEAAVGFVSWWLWVGKRLWPRGMRWVMRRKCARFERRARTAATV
jgi:NAD(P)-dependent dehydrogenase (short-subunit alcohol dehydrogenase family)